MSSIHAQVTSSNSDLKSCVQWDYSSCAFPRPHWLRQTSIFNSEWWGVTLPQPWMGKTIHYCTSIAALTEAVAAEMSWAGLKNSGKLYLESIALHSLCEAMTSWQSITLLHAHKICTITMFWIDVKKGTFCGTQVYIISPKQKKMTEKSSHNK